TYYNPAAQVSLRVSSADVCSSVPFGALSGKTFGDADFSVSASASSGLAVSFTAGATDQCTVTGSTVHLTGAGSCTITAHQAGDRSEEPRAGEERTFARATASPVRS